MDVRSAGWPYPPAPWLLHGWGFATVQAVDVRAARRWVPPDSTIVAIAPGRTLGGLVFVSYEAGSTLVYRELTIVAALVRVGTRVAFYLPRLYVDSDASLAGGRAIWGVPKDPARFEVTASAAQRTVAVTSGDRAICRLQASAARPGLRLRVPVPALGARADRFLFFTGRLRARAGLVNVIVELPRDGEFRALSLDRPSFAVSLESFDLCVPAPTEVRRTTRQPVHAGAEG